MNAFDGRLREIPAVSVDRFSAANLDSEAYFLSHCHSDHMRGLATPEFARALLSRDGVYLYASPVTKAVLDDLHPRLAPKVRSLDVRCGHAIRVPGNDAAIQVTLVPAAHCPGSVMFLFETGRRTVLYTGDARLRVDELRKAVALHDRTGRVKKIDRLYTDTTFLDDDHAAFPTRERAVAETVRLAREWIDAGPDRVVTLDCPARYGYEGLFVDLATALGRPVHVGARASRIYARIPEMDGAVTDDASATPLHSACSDGPRPRLSDVCRTAAAAASLNRTIRPCALSWTTEQAANVVRVDRDGVYRVCYSTHWSRDELTRVLAYLGPADVHPCVLPEDPVRRDAMLALVRGDALRHPPDAVLTWKIPKLF